MPPDILRRIRDEVDRQGAVQRTDPVNRHAYHADVMRREPTYEPRETVEYDHDARDVHFPMPDTHGTDKVVGPSQDEAGYRIAYPQRRLIVIDRFKRSGNVVLDGTGAGSVTLTGSVPPNQSWLIDRVVARANGAGAAGSLCMLYEGSTANDDGLLAVLNLGANNVAQIDGNPIQVNPGGQLFASFVAAGAGLTATVRIFFRVVMYVPGRSEDEV